MAVVGVFGAGGDRDVWLFTGCSAVVVEYVLLQQPEEALRGRVVAGRGYWAYGSEESVTGQGAGECPASELGSSVRKVRFRAG